MTPRPPDDMKWGIYIPKWVPGTPIEVDSYSATPSFDDSNLRDAGHSLFWFLVIGLPLIFVTITAGGIWCCCQRSKTWKLRLAAASEVVRNAEAVRSAEAVKDGG